MVELIEGKTREEVLGAYKDYPDIYPDGIENYHVFNSRVAPIFYEIPKGSKVLDIGCNSGEFMRLLRDKKECDVYGVDVAEDLIAKCQAKGLSAQVADAEHLPFPDASFDYVTLMEVLVHVFDPVAMLKEIRRVLKPKGILLGSAPHANLERYAWEDNRMHHRYYDEPALRDHLETSFPFVDLRILKGAQFAIGLATTHMSGEPVEFLFKCGEFGTPKWEQELMDDKTLRVWMGFTQLEGDVYYRMWVYAEKMRKMGLQIAYEPFEFGGDGDKKSKAWQQRIRNKIVLNQFENLLRVAHMSIWQISPSRDVLAFLRCAKDLANERHFRAGADKKLFLSEVDDDLFDIPSYNIASNPYRPNSEVEWVAKEQLALSDAVITSTDYLAEKIRAIFPGKQVFVVPNSLDFDLWDHLDPDKDFPPKEEGQIRIGFTGSSNHRMDLELIREPLIAILEEFPHVQFVFTPQSDLDSKSTFIGWTGSDGKGIKNMVCVNKFVPINRYPNFVAGWGMDIGIAPLRDNSFNRAKSNLRWLEYSGLRIPTIASKVEPFKKSIRNGIDGIVCNSNQEWYEDLRSLIVDAGRRTAIGQAAYERVKQDFNADVIAKHYADILEGLHHATNGS